MRDAVLASLARAVLGDPHASARAPIALGPYTLLPHQHEAVLRLTPILQKHGGALLADAVGLGKTFVALAIARAYTNVDVVAPAGLLRMWRETSDRCHMQPATECFSLHRFSFRPAAVGAARAADRLVIVDEAHHLRNPRTKRYANVAERCRSAHVLLLTATPVHNRENDLSHLLALFLGTRAQSLSSTEQLALLVRREADVLESGSESAHAPRHTNGHTDSQPPTQLTARPVLQSHPAVTVSPDSGIADSTRAITLALTHLPPPVPTRDGAAAGALIALGLLRSWCSSAAACLAAVRRRRARATALADVFAAGRWPTQQELRTWTITEDTVQLGFTSLLVADDSRIASQQRSSEFESAGDPSVAQRIENARAQLETHQLALSTLEMLVRQAAPTIDRARAECLRRIRRRHPGLAVIVFTQFADSVYAMGRVLRWDVGVATLTSRGGRVSGGSLARGELLRRVAPRAHGVAPPSPHERILLLLTTDLLAEGVNLQDAGVVVHLDLPWTPAAIAQREGRIARLGSAHRIVHAYALSPPGDAESLLRVVSRLRRKARAMMVALAPDAAPRRATRLVALPSSSSPLHETLRRWQRGTPEVLPEQSRELVLSNDRAGWLAVVNGRLVGGWLVPRRQRSTNGASYRFRTNASSDVRTIAALVRAADVAVEGTTRDRREIATFTQIVRAALHREASRLHRTAVVDTLQSPLVRAHRHIRRTLTAMSLGDRVRLAPLVAAATAALRTLRGAGDERALESLFDASAIERTPEQWLRGVIALAGQSPDSPTKPGCGQRDLLSDRSSSSADAITPWQTLVLLLP